MRIAEPEPIPVVAPAQQVQAEKPREETTPDTPDLPDEKLDDSVAETSAKEPETELASEVYVIESGAEDILVTVEGGEPEVYQYEVDEPEEEPYSTVTAETIDADDFVPLPAMATETIEDNGFYEESAAFVESLPDVTQVEPIVNAPSGPVVVSTEAYEKIVPVLERTMSEPEMVASSQLSVQEVVQDTPYTSDEFIPVPQPEPVVISVNETAEAHVLSGTTDDSSETSKITENVFIPVPVEQTMSTTTETLQDEKQVIVSEQPSTTQEVVDIPKIQPDIVLVSSNQTEERHAVSVVESQLEITPNTQTIQEAKPVKEVVSEVLLILNTESETQTPMENIPIETIQHENIAIIAVEGKLILGTAEQGEKNESELTVAPVMSLGELGKAFNTATTLISLPDTQGEGDEKKKDAVVMLISSDMLLLLDSIGEQQAGKDDNTGEKKAAITFVVGGDQPQKREVSAEAFTLMRTLLGSEPEQTSDEKNITTIIKLSEVFTSMLQTPDTTLPENDSRQTEPLFVSHQVMMVLENLRKKLPVPETSVENSPVDGRVEHQTMMFMTTGEDPKSLTLSKEEIQQFQEFFAKLAMQPEARTEKTKSVNGMNWGNAFDSLIKDAEQARDKTVGNQEITQEFNQVVTVAESLISERNPEIRLEVSLELLAFIDQKMHHMKDEEQDIFVHRQVITLISGEQEVVIDQELLRKIQELLKQTKPYQRTFFVPEDEQSPEEVKVKINPFQAGADMFLLAVYRSLLSLLSEPEFESRLKQIQYPVFHIGI